MTVIKHPALRPANAHFSSGPCSKRPEWSLEALQDACLGRSHRSKPGKTKLALAIDLTRDILNIPADYKIGIVPGSDTGAVEMALWSMLGARGVDMLAWESFGSGWITDVVKQLKLDNVTQHIAAYGLLPDLEKINFDNDVVFTWNGTTSGVRVPNGDWIADDRQGLTICDATSAVFATDLPWEKLDVVTYSWQKVLGSEGAHGMIILSPLAVERLENYTPVWPLPKIFRLTKNGKLIDGIFNGATINTPSMLALEDYLDALNWVKNNGGLAGMIARADKNATEIANWVAKTDWVDFLPKVIETRSNTSVCLKVVDADILKLDAGQQAKFAKKIAGLLDAENVAKDIGGYRDAPAGLRIWTGSTIEASDVTALMLWLDWAFASAKADL